MNLVKFVRINCVPKHSGTTKLKVVYKWLNSLRWYNEVDKSKKQWIAGQDKLPDKHKNAVLKYYG